MAFDVRFRPIDRWPGEMRKTRRADVFRAGFTDTLGKLEDELRQLRACDLVIMLDLSEEDIRLDGWPRAQAKPGHPGVIVAFQSVHGPLKYCADAYLDWKANLRAIALGLEALRAVDRYGITRRGEQYTGWRALPAGRTDAAMTLEQAARWVVEVVGGVASMILSDAGYWRDKYRAATAKLHPDRCGNDEQFKHLQEARRLIDGHHGIK